MKKPTFIPHWSVIEHAWSAAWRYKQAWAFGLVAFLVDFGGIFESIFKALPIGGRIGGLLDAGSWMQFIIPINVVWDSLVSLVMAPTMTVALLAALGSIFAVVLFLLGASIVTLGVGALVWTAERATDGRPAPWREALINALRNFWPLLVIVMGTKVVTVFFLGISGLGLSWLLRSGSLSAATAFLLSFILFGFVSIAVSLLAVFSANEVVVNRHGLVDSLRLALLGLRRHWIASIEAAAMILVATVIIFLLALVTLMVIAVPIIFLIALTSSVSMDAIPVLLISLTVFLSIALLIISAAYAGTMQVFAWNAFWQKIGHRTALSRVIGWFGKLIGK
jgi:hypothetical protein